MYEYVVNASKANIDVFLCLIPQGAVPYPGLAASKQIHLYLFSQYRFKLLLQKGT